MSRTEIHYCKKCQCDRRHDVFKDGLAIGKPVDGFERAFFGIFTLGMSELVTDWWRKCQACDRRTKL